VSVLRGLLRRRPGARETTEIAVVVPLYNHARYIGATLRSVLAQTAAPREILLLDDGSRDDGLAIARALLRDIAGARIIAQDNAGGHAALNRAIGETEAPYIAVLNSDDLFVPQKLAWCQAIFAATQADLVAGRPAMIDERGRRLRRGPSAAWLARAEAFATRTGFEQLSLLHENFVVSSSNMVFSRALWRRAGGFANLRTCHDLDFLMRAYDNGRVTIDRSRVHVQYRVHTENTVHADDSLLHLEVAAVTAATFRQSGTRLLPDAAARDAYDAMLRARGSAPRVAQLADVFSQFDSRDAFFAHVMAEADRWRFMPDV
jgi:GT2 family glycosyltransferase